MRLDKFLAQHLGISRALVGRELRTKKVTIDDQIVKSGALKINPQQVVRYDGRELVQISGFRYFMLNKPENMVCSTVDSFHPTIFELFDEPVADKFHAAGRLDQDTTGLVLLTDDGQWSHRITSPRHHFEKVYLVGLQDPITEKMIEQFAEGIPLQGEKTLTQPAQLTEIESVRACVRLREGRYHQIKRMFAAVGNHVMSLHRESIGAICLDPELQPGEYRALTQDEIDSVYSVSG